MPEEITGKQIKFLMIPEPLLPALLLLTAFFFAGTNTAHAQELTMHATAASAYNWRGITRHDKVVAHPAIEIRHHEFKALVWGVIRGDELDDINNQGLFGELDVELAYRLELHPYSFEMGYTEYMFAVDAENTREVFGELLLPVNDYLTLEMMLAYDMGAYKDFYFMTGGLLTGELTPNLYANAEITVAAAGNGFSLGTESGFHDFGITLGLTHHIDADLSWGVSIKQSGSLDKKVLPEQEVESVLAAMVSMDF